MKIYKRVLLACGALLFAALVLISSLPKDSFIKLPFNTFVVKLVDLPCDSETTRAALGYESQSWELYLDYYERKGYTFLGTGGAGAFEFEKNGEIKRFFMPNILQFRWFI